MGAARYRARGEAPLFRIPARGVHNNAYGKRAYRQRVQRIQQGGVVRLPYAFCQRLRNDDIHNEIQVKWRSHAYLIFANWLNYYVYQQTPYNLDDLKER